MINFCAAICNRLWQLEETLPHNLATLEGRHAITIADLHSTDGLERFIWDYFSAAIEARHLIYFRADHPCAWSAPKGKNLAARLSAGEYLFNLDADNWVTKYDLELIEECEAAGFPVHQWTETYGDGSFGRIGMPRKVFEALGGYEESFLPMFHQDVDLLKRLRKIENAAVSIGAPAKAAIANKMKDKLAKISTNGRLVEAKHIHETNIAIARARLRLYGPKRNEGFASYRGTLNGEHVLIDGVRSISELRADYEDLLFAKPRNQAARA